MSYPCVLLAAGSSSRMGKNKLLLPLGEGTVVRRSALAMLARCAPLIVVTGKDREKVEEALLGIPDIVFAFNPDWANGMVGSAKTGIAALPDRGTPFFLHHADMPFVETAVLDKLYIAEKDRSEARMKPLALFASLNGAAGHPVLFPPSYIPALMRAGMGESLRGIVEELGRALVETGCEAVLEDVDSPEDFEVLSRKYPGPGNASPGSPP